MDIKLKIKPELYIVLSDVLLWATYSPNYLLQWFTKSEHGPIFHMKIQKTYNYTHDEETYEFSCLNYSCIWNYKHHINWKYTIKSGLN
jgi:hypothetical protein